MATHRLTHEGQGNRGNRVLGPALLTLPYRSEMSLSSSARLLNYAVTPEEYRNMLFKRAQRMASRRPLGSRTEPQTPDRRFGEGRGHGVVYGPEELRTF